MRLLAVGIGFALASASPMQAQGIEETKAMLAVVGLDMSSSEIVTWCEARAPGQSAVLRSTWQAWRSAADVDRVASRLDADMLRRGREGMQSVLAATRQRLQGAGPPTTVCPQLVTMWASAEFDARRTYSAAYSAVSETTDSAPASSRRTTAAASAPPSTTASSEVPAGNDAALRAPRPLGRFNPEYYSEVARPSGTVYTVAQMTALRQQWVGEPFNYERGKRNMRAAGTLYITGKVTRHGERFFLDTDTDAFTSELSVAPDIPLSAFDGQQITLQGHLEDLPNSLVFLQDTRVVRDPSALRPSTLSSAAGIERKEVAESRITTAAGRGVQPQDIVGMHYHWYGATTVNGYQMREEVRLLFKDGWAYTRNEVPPSDLDVAASRRLEPQYWARWRRAGNEYEFQRRDDHGNPEGDWARKSGRIVSTFPANQRLNGTYTAQSFYGSIALGGTYSSTSFRFSPDGRWERIGYSQSSSGSMAAQQPVGFSSSASSVSDGSGTKSSAGGGNASVTTASSSTRNDGAKNRGTYRLDGMTLELRSDAGEVTRVLCLPMDATLKSIFLQGKSFSKKS